MARWDLTVENVIRKHRGKRAFVVELVAEQRELELKCRLGQGAWVCLAVTLRVSCGWRRLYSLCLSGSHFVIF